MAQTNQNLEYRLQVRCPEYPQCRLRSHARLLVSELTEHVDLDALDWLVRK